ncbi:cysteine-rich CWC family protein [Zhongshania aquimaris]|uniref:Cysteine-rich CWC family protein n=1 Tax=Zhongshania aquimaris TaxID=2857107 RepID=A0ABS6VPM1_9GAMM|nr:cysteine-rich CWC family protein [Zhongshania aquimaris]MBW2940264.1 cysteine-rich CWC family protein [Zhongshania aquimaris]
MSNNGTSPASNFNPALCPLCEQANQCAVAAGEDPSSCWCMYTVISENAKRTANQQGDSKRCLCKQCGRPLDK